MKLWTRVAIAREDAALWRQFRVLTMANRRRFCANLALVRERERCIDLSSGCYVECGTWHGGVSFAVMQLETSLRDFHFFDSFAGLPRATEKDGAIAMADQAARRLWYDNNTADAAEFASNVERFRRTEQSVSITKGWFQDTLPKFPAGKNISLLRMDGDWYDSTMCILRNLFDQVVPGGLVIIDDYYDWDGCARAVHEYLGETSASDRLHEAPGHFAYLIKEPRTGSGMG
jgi:O-methyltransferase